MELVNYPLQPPHITIQTHIRHPNIFGDYVCASILNTEEGYTPAYTLKSIAIQLLSFFSSDSLEQEYGGVVDLTRYRARNMAPNEHHRGYHCYACGFDSRPPHRNHDDQWAPADQPRLPPIRPSPGTPSRQIKGHRFVEADERRRMTDGARMTSLDGSVTESLRSSDTAESTASRPPPESSETSVSSTLSLLDLPNEILLIILSSLSFYDMLAIAEAIPRARQLIDVHDLKHLPEIRCFCLKEHFQDSKLGVGVAVGGDGREKKLSSEFDLLSASAFHEYGIRKSIHGIDFRYWLPLPISRRHWRLVQSQTFQSLQTLGSAAGFSDDSYFGVLSHFLNDIVVTFSEEAENASSSTLTHASEKAVEAYFSIYHILLCLAAEAPFMVRKANNQVSSFLSGKTNKNDCPNLGLLLVATLISDHGLSESLSVVVIKEAVLRNVVWMLDSKGANMPELSYLEPSAVSDYRLKRTFQASLTSYRLLMFCHLFCKTARGLTVNKTLAQLRDELFDMHGAPPRGVAQSMAQEIRRIKTIDAFPPFLKGMGIQDRNIPTKAEFTSFLRRMVVQSVDVGYSKFPITQSAALALRVLKEPSVEVARGLVPGRQQQVERKITFFPGRTTTTFFTGKNQGKGFRGVEGEDRGTNKRGQPKRTRET
ncbi:MAG: hypothetical protein Q9174_002273 [Haloplaca sp. 1 TL-2023]